MSKTERVVLIEGIKIENHRVLDEPEISFKSSYQVTDVRLSGVVHTNSRLVYTFKARLTDEEQTEFLAFLTRISERIKSEL